MADYDIDALDREFGGGKPVSGATGPSSVAYDLPELDKEFGGNNLKRVYVTGKPAKEKTAEEKYYEGISPIMTKMNQGVVQGFKDVANTAATYGAKMFGSDEAVKNMEENAKASREAYDASNPPTEGWMPTPAGTGRAVGQALATAPLMPMKALQAGKVAIEYALPVAGRFLSPVATGATGGALFGAATKEATDNSLASHVGENALAGAVAGPVAELAIGGIRSTLAGITNWTTAKIALRNSGISPQVADNLIERMAETGKTPAQIAAELKRLGPDATLADVAPSLTGEASGLAAMTGPQSEILKTRYANRASGANAKANEVMEVRLGPKPDFEVEVEAAKQARKAATSSDYTKAYASNQAFEVAPIIEDIDKKLVNAVGGKATALEKAKSYLTDKNGHIKHDVEPLHEVRQALDDDIEKLVNAGAGSSSEARALNDVRSKVDAQLKQNYEMEVADIKFAKLAEDAKGLVYGKSAIGAKPNIDKFEKDWHAASPEKKEYIRKGLRVAIGDMMETAARGELAGAQQLLGKKAGNRSIVKLAFGGHGEAVLDELEKEALKRGTERGVTQGSQTAERQAVRQRYEPREAQGLGGLDIMALGELAGAHGSGVLAAGGKKYLAGKIEKAANEAREAKKLGTADVLSRQGAERDAAIRQIGNVANRKISLALPTSIRTGSSIPMTREIPTNRRVGANVLTNLTIPPIEELKKRY